MGGGWEQERLLILAPPPPIPPSRGEVGRGQALAHGANGPCLAASLLGSGCLRQSLLNPHCEHDTTLPMPELGHGLREG